MANFVLLGAGFSRAISASMPLLADLAPEVLTELGEDATVLAPFGDNLEQWMSYLSVAQPWLDDAANLRNRAQFLEASKAVQRCINRAESTVDYPDAWLERLIHEWCDSESVVATFNYDLLVERTTSTLGRVSTWLDLYGMPLDTRESPSRGLSYGYPRPPGPLFSLFKLHGSVNWSYGGFDAPPTDRVVQTHEELWWRQGGMRDSAPSVGNILRFDDLEPLIVPPTGTKGPYYGNRSLRGQWRRVFGALRTAEAVTIIGYSFPATDLITRHLIATADLNCPVTVVDRGETVASIVAELAPRASVRAYSGHGAVQNFVAASCGDFVRWQATSHPDGWEPRLVVNGAEQALRPAPGDFDALLSSEHQNSASAWLNQEADRRVPGLAGRPRYQLRRPYDETAWVGSYSGGR